MYRLIKIRVIRDFERLEEQVRGRLDALLEAQKAAAAFLPAADFYETTEGLVLRLELAGVAPEEVSLSLAGHELLVRGQRRPPSREGIRRFMHQEMAFGLFERRFVLPIAVDPQAVEARYAHGILEVSLPRKVPMTRQISVTSPTSE